MRKLYEVTYQEKAWDKVSKTKVIAKSKKSAKEVVAKELNTKVEDIATIYPEFIKNIK